MPPPSFPASNTWSYEAHDLHLHCSPLPSHTPFKVALELCRAAAKLPCLQNLVLRGSAYLHLHNLAVLEVSKWCPYSCCCAVQVGARAGRGWGREGSEQGQRGGVGGAAGQVRGGAELMQTLPHFAGHRSKFIASHSSAASPPAALFMWPSPCARPPTPLCPPTRPPLSAPPPLHRLPRLDSVPPSSPLQLASCSGLESLELELPPVWPLVTGMNGSVGDLATANVAPRHRSV